MTESGIVQKPLLSSFDKPPGAAITPDEVVSMLFGADSIKLNGFGGQPVESPFWLPNLQTFDHQKAQQVVSRLKIVKRRLFATAALLALVSIGGLLFSLGTLLNDGAASQALSWTPKAVIQDGVVITIGTTLVTIPTGSMLPSGEILRSVNTTRQIFATDNSETAVRR